jgi:hypothetical protein
MARVLSVWDSTLELQLQNPWAQPHEQRKQKATRPKWSIWVALFKLS